jgi:hypothetical protein
MYFILAVLFFVLSPGILLTLPPVGKKVFLSGKTSLLAAAVHAVVFWLVIRCLKWRGLLEGFQTSTSAETSSTPVAAVAASPTQAMPVLRDMPCHSDFSCESPNLSCAKVDKNRDIARNYRCKLKTGQPCSITAECEPGNYCKVDTLDPLRTMKCVPSILPSSINCTSNDNCPSSYTCITRGKAKTCSANF